MATDNPDLPVLSVNRMAPAAGVDHISVDGPMKFKNPADAIALLQAISDAEAYLAAFVEANPDFATTFSTIEAQFPVLSATVASNTTGISNLTPDVQTPTFVTGTATVTLTKPKTLIVVPATSAGANFIVKLNEAAKQDGWEVEVYFTKTNTGTGSFSPGASVSVRNSTGATVYMNLVGQGVIGSYHYFQTMRWDAASNTWVRKAGWEATNSPGASIIPLGAGTASLLNVAVTGSGSYGLVPNNDAFFQQPPLTKRYDLLLINGTNAFCQLLPDGTFNFPDHDQFNLVVEDFTGSTWVFPPSGNYELNVDGAGVASGNVDIGAASLSAPDVYQALASAVQMDALSQPYVISYWDGSTWNVQVSNGVGINTGISFWSWYSDLWSSGFCINSADGANPLTGWSLGLDGSVTPTNSGIVINSPIRSFRITDIQLIPLTDYGPLGTPGAAVTTWVNEVVVSSDYYGDLVWFGSPAYGGFTTGSQVKSLAGNSPDAVQLSNVLTQDYPNTLSILVGCPSLDLSTQQYALLRVIADFNPY